MISFQGSMPINTTIDWSSLTCHKTIHLNLATDLRIESLNRKSIRRKY